MSIKSTLFPPANRTAALVAFLRTFWQTVRGVGGLTILGGGALVINHAATIDWPTIGWAAIGIIGSGIIAGALSGGDILTNGLPTAYIATVTPSNIIAEVKVPDSTPTLSGRHTGTSAPYTLTAPAVTDINAAYPVGWQTAPTVLPPAPTTLPPVPTMLEPAPAIAPAPLTYLPDPLTGM